jgi:very-short-patch-repair endonuclease
VYAVGSPDLTELGRLMAAVLACGDGAVISHDSAPALYGILKRPPVIHLSVPSRNRSRPPGLRIHRRATLRPEDVTRHRGIPVTTPIATIVDLAATKPRGAIERLVSEADIAGLCTPEAIRAALDAMPRRPGCARLRELLDRHTFRLTRSELERLFLPLAEAAGVSRPLTRQIVNGFEVDFHWPALKLVVESDGLRYHRTAQQQTADMVREQHHTAAGLTCLRFSHWQIANEQAYVRATLAAVAARLTRVASAA